jgi:PKD repeat protein
MKKQPLLKLVLLSVTLLWCIPVSAQLKRGGTPPSFAAVNRTMRTPQQFQSLKAPDLAPLKAEDAVRAKNGQMPRVSQILPANYTLQNSGEWFTLPTGEKIWQLRLKSPGAIALTLYYDRFYLPEGARLFIYSANKKHVVGAFTAADNPQHGPEFSTEMIAGDELVLEYVAPEQPSQPAVKAAATGGASPEISISGVGYVYNNSIISVAKEFYEPSGPGREGMSAACMININCPEGGAWQDQKKGVAATLQRIAGSGWVCSGTILNNTAKDWTPYFLMAYHCGEANGRLASEADLNQWQFYFHFERTACDNSSPVAAYRTATGAQRLVATNISGGSDGLLLRLNAHIPDDWDVYFNGWNRSNTPLQSGAGIHHPMGDLKKISFATQPATESTWFSMEGMGAPDAHWRVDWGAVNGKKGVTEGGSSGSPLFDQNGLVVGSLSGGNGNDTDPCATNTYSLYGKLWWHWDQSPNPDERMSKYLDPVGSGAITLEGSYPRHETVANFVADTHIYVTQSVTYKDMSLLAATWEWAFAGGSPASYIGRTPPAITYNTVGVFTTTLTINKGTPTEQSVAKTITVSPKDKLMEEIIGTGAPTNANAPLSALDSHYRYHRSAMLYHKEELAWMDGAGAITSLGWQKNAEDLHPRHIKIWVKHYAATAVDLDTVNTVAYNSGLFAGAKLVVDTAGFKNATGYCEFPFNRGDKQFAYDPDSSLLILVETDYLADSPVIVSATPARVMSNHTKAVVEKADGAKAVVKALSRPVVRITYKVTPAAPVADFNLSDVNGIFSERFDGDQFPAGWTVEKPGASSQKWEPDNFWGYDFNLIDPSSTNSACIIYDVDKEVDSWLKSPVIAIPATAVPKISFYIFFGGKDAPADMVKFYISEDNGAHWAEKWANSYEDLPAWRQVLLDIREYAGKNIQLAWRYTGKDLDGAAIDNLLVYGRQDSVVTIYIGGAVAFTDRSSGPPVSWKWALPGASPATSAAANLTATYTAAGTYDVSLTVASDLGTDTKVRTGAVIVKKMPLDLQWKTGSDGYTLYPHGGQFLPAEGGAVRFTDVSPVKPDTRVWLLPGATPASATEETVEALYPAAGQDTSYYAVLKIANDVEEKTDTIYVKAGGVSEIWNVAANESPVLYTNFTNTGWYERLSERFAAAKPGMVYKVRVYTGNVTQTAADSMTVALYSDDNGLPGTLLSPVMAVPGGSIANGGYNTITFPSPVGVPKAFHVVIATTNTDSTNFVVPSVSRRAFPHSTVKVFGFDGWHDMGDYNGIYTSMNVIPEFTYTLFELTSKDTIKKKNMDTKADTIAFKTDAAAWTAVADPWITLSHAAGAGADVMLTFTVAENKAPEIREGLITVKAGGGRAYITVLQGGGRPRNLKAVYYDDNKSIKLAWDDTVEPFFGIFDDIEGHTPLAVNSAGTVGWTYIDGDGKDINGYPIFTKRQMAFAVLEVDTESGIAHSGTKVFACPTLDSSVYENNDWLISPALDFAASYSVPSFTFSFWARSMDVYLDRMRVAYSTTGNAESDFTHVLTAEPYIEVPNTWTKYSYKIPAAARYVAINGVSDYWGSTLLIDDIAIGIGTAPVSAQAGKLHPHRANAGAATNQKVKFERLAAEKRLASPLKASLQRQSLPAGDEKVIRWDNGTYEEAVGVPAGGKIEVAAKFEPSDLKDYKNASVKAVEIAIKNIGSDMMLKIWQGETVVHSQPIKVSLPAENFNTIELTKPVAIDITKDLIVSYSFTQAPGYDYVPGCDAGPAVAGKGDLVSLDGSPFESLSNSGLDCNWNIAVTLVGGVSQITYNVYRNGTLIAENLPERGYEDAKPPKADTVYYNVTAVYDDDPFFESTLSDTARLYSKAHLTVGVRDTAKTEAENNPPFSAYIKDGLLAGDNPSDILQHIKFATPATSLSAAGTYLISPVFRDLAGSTYADSYVFVAAPGILTVKTFPTNITQQPAGAVVCRGGNHTFAVSATGLNVKYQWQHQVNGAWTNIGEEILTSGTATSNSHPVSAVTVADAGYYRVLVNGRSDKQASNAVALRVGLPHDSLIVYKWADIPTVNNNPLTNGGYSFVEFLWLRDGVAVEGRNKPYIQVPAGSAATYEVYLTTDRDLPLAVCPFVPQVRTASLAVYPNPVRQGASLTLQSANLPEGSVVNIYSSTGTLVKGNLPLFGGQNRLDIDGLSHGLYVLQVLQPDGNKQTINIVVN